MESFIDLLEATSDAVLKFVINLADSNVHSLFLLNFKYNKRKKKRKEANLKIFKYQFYLKFRIQAANAFKIQST